MVSDSDLIARLREFLSQSDLNTTTTAIVRRRLEEDFGLDLSDRKAFIREQVDLYLQSQFESAVENEENGIEESDGGDREAAPEEEEEESSTRKTASRKRSKTKKKETNKTRGGAGGGFTKLCNLSSQLQKFTGVQQLARTQVVKQIWSYIRENNLQDPSYRRDIICDDTLRDLFGVDIINMFQMNKELSKHIWPLDSDGPSFSSTPKEKPRKPEREAAKQSMIVNKSLMNLDCPTVLMFSKCICRTISMSCILFSDPDEPKRNTKRQKGGNSAILAPLSLSEALVKFLGTGEDSLRRCDVVRRMWVYIKQNNLQDPSDKRQIICDEKLKELLDVDTFHGFSMLKLLSPHFTKGEQVCS
ncbi:hypothetical protein OROGR_008134 [Orobanche gracilis]